MTVSDVMLRNNAEVKRHEVVARFRGAAFGTDISLAIKKSSPKK